MTPRTATPVATWGLGVKLLREIHSLTQEQLAQRAGTKQATISRIETGSRQVSDALRVRIARALNVNPYDLFPYEDDSAAAS